MNSSTLSQRPQRRQGGQFCLSTLPQAQALAPGSRRSLFIWLGLVLGLLLSPPIATARESLQGSPFSYFEQANHQSLTDASLSNFDSLSGAVVDLLSYLRSHVDPEPREQLVGHIPAYNRRQHFGGWINGDPEKNCLDTRSEVLVRDAVQGSEVTYKKGTCMVIAGHWQDPYTATEFKMARAVQIDHVVPLKNAYLSGAWNWSFARRCHYANYLGNRFHLLAVSGHENMVKSDRGPERYMPPDENFHCAYLKDWLKIKAIWELNVTPDEKSAIERMLEERHCPEATAQVSAIELAVEVEKAKAPNAKCLELAARPAGGVEAETSLASPPVPVPVPPTESVPAPALKLHPAP
jgi:hypothetical protein